MGLEINRLSKGDDDMTGTPVTEGRVYRTTDGEFVGEGDTRGAFLAYGAGVEVAPADVDRYKRYKDGASQDVATDGPDRDALRRRQAGDVSERTPLGQTPVPIHDRLATELADEAAALASRPASEVAAARNAEDGDDVYAEHAVWRTATGDLVHEGDEAGATVAYAVGALIDPADVDEYNDLGDPPAAPDTDPAKAAAKPADKSGRKPANK